MAPVLLVWIDVLPPVRAPLFPPAIKTLEPAKRDTPAALLAFPDFNDNTPESTPDEPVPTVTALFRVAMATFPEVSKLAEPVIICMLPPCCSEASEARNWTSNPSTEDSPCTINTEPSTVNSPAETVTETPPEFPTVEPVDNIKLPDDTEEDEDNIALAWDCMTTPCPRIPIFPLGRSVESPARTCTKPDSNKASPLRSDNTAFLPAPVFMTTEPEPRLLSGERI